MVSQNNQGRFLDPSQELFLKFLKKNTFSEKLIICRTELLTRRTDRKREIERSTQFNVKIKFLKQVKSGAYFKPCQTSKVECFAKIANGF